jgi:glyoxylase-like metal-dependent hydrolase (beta-lactamase superfamily II)
MSDPMDQPTLKTLADKLIVREAVDVMGWLSIGEQGVVVDALEQPGEKDDVFAAIERTLSSTPIRYLLNTHTHYDHTALNEAIVDRWGAEIINRSVTDLPADGRMIEGSRRTVTILPIDVCHADDAVVWVQPDEVLFVGDAFGWGLIPPNGNLTGDQPERIAAAYEKMIAFEARHVVPGHGPTCTTDHLRRWLDYYRWLFAEVSPLVKADASESQIKEQLPPPEDMRDWWRFVDWKHENSLEKVIAAVRNGVEL